MPTPGSSPPPVKRRIESDSASLRILHELIAALDRRLPQMQHARESAIARDAAALKDQARARIAELESAPASVDPP